MTILVTRIDPDAARDDRQVLAAVRAIAGRIAREANRTSAEIGITYRDLPDGSGVRVGPHGAAGLPLEIGTRRIPARRYVKRALDARRIR